MVMACPVALILNRSTSRYHRPGLQLQENVQPEPQTATSLKKHNKISNFNDGEPYKNHPEFTVIVLLISKRVSDF
jgi:hypothetical protein